MNLDKSMSQEGFERKVIIKCRGGGSLIDKPLLFTPKGLAIIVPCKNLLRSFSTVSGEIITDYEGSDDYIVNAHISPSNPKLLLACSVKGEILCWKLKTELLISKTKLGADIDEVNQFLMMPPNDKLDKDNYEMLVTWTRNDEQHMGIFRTNCKKVVTQFNLKVKDKIVKVDIGGYKDFKFITAIEENKLFCVNIRTKKVQTWRIGRGRIFTCVRCPKEQLFIATGDTSGCILIWYNIFNDSGPSQSKYHWHILPIRCLTFSESGTELYSGAEERVVVKWQLDNANRKLFMPRLPAPIAHLTCGPDNMYIAVCTNDNAIRLVDAQLQLKCVVQQLVKMGTCQAGLKAIPSGTITATSGAIVLNGRPGHLQFYSPKDQTLLYNLDIVAQNQITPEREMDIPNTDITQDALSQDGRWLATFECLKPSSEGDKKDYRELRLKFWLFEEKQRTFILNTSIEFPHEEAAITGIVFQTFIQQANEVQNACCVTVGEDKRFRIWNITDTSNINTRSIGWHCFHISQYRHLDCLSANFSSDGSLLGVSFGPSLTLWRPDNCELVASLTKPLADATKDAVKFIQFGAVEYCHLVVVANERELMVWSLLTLGMVWKVPVKLKLLSGDPKSEFMAAVTINDTLFVFSPGSSSLIYSLKNIYGETSSIKTLGMVFIPRGSCSESLNTLNWQKESQLYLLNSQQELLTLEVEDDPEERSRLEFTSNKPLSAFAATLPGIMINQVAKQTSSDAHKFGVAANCITFKQLLAPPVHTTAPMRALCAAVLRSVILTSNTKPPTKQVGTEFDEDSPMDVDDADLSDDDVPKRRLKPEPVPNDETTPDDNETTPDLESVKAESTSWTSIFV